MKNAIPLILAAFVLTAAGCTPAAVPTPSSSLPAGWKTFTTSDGSFAFDYPTVFGKTVWHPRSWPPAVTLIAGTEDPVEKGCPDIPAGTEKKTVKENGVEFTVLTASDAGAGSLYDNYCYYAKRGDNYYAVDFVIWSHLGCGDGQCGAYCDTQYEAECKALDRDKDIKRPIDAVAATFRFLK